MRTKLTCLVLFIAVVVLAVPAFAGGSTAVSSSWSAASQGFDLVVSVDEKTEIPAGRLTIWFSNQIGGEPQYWYLGSSRNIIAPVNPSMAYCMVRVDLEGRYADQQVETTWQPVPGEQRNLFWAPVNAGEQEFKVWIKGKTVTHLKILFFSIRTGSSVVRSVDGFRVFARANRGTTDLEAQREIAAARWPGLTPADHDLWARMWVYETHYLAQGMISAGTETNPVVSTASLKDLYDLRQARVDQCTEKRQSDEARARAEADARERDARAKAEREAREAEEAAKAAEEDARAKAEAEANDWPSRLTEKYAGNTGFIFIAVGADGRPSGKKLSFHFYQMRSDNSWKENSASPMSLDDCGEGSWFFGGCTPKWKGFGLTTSGDVPTKMYTIHQSGLRIIAVPDNGSDSYEVR